MNKKKITMDDIAKALNISKVSVHKAMNNQTDISKDLKEQILNKAAELGYTMIDPLTKLCRHFFFFLPKRYHLSTEQFYFGIYSKLKETFESIGAVLELKVVDDDFSPVNFEKNMSRIIKGNFAFFLAGQFSHNILKEFESLNISCVCIDFYSQNYNLNYIFLDNFRGGYLITDYLVQKGHKKICFIVDITTSSTNADKYFGYLKSLYENKIEFSNEMVIKTTLEAPQQYLNLKLPTPMPTAFLFHSDQSAYKFMISMMSQGFKIPEDISVASFDNTDISIESNPSITSVGMDKNDLNDACYNIMLKNLLSFNKKKYNYTLSPQIHIRNSVKKIK